MLLSLCETTKKAVVKDDKIVIAPMVNLNWTIDHRFLDGGRVKKLIANVIFSLNELLNTFSLNNISPILMPSRN